MQMLQALNPKIPVRIKVLEGSCPPGKDYELYRWSPFVNIWGKVKRPIYTRGILPNEILIDPDSPEWQVMKEGIEKLSLYCKENNIPFNMGFSGGKGIHVSIYFGNIVIDAELEDEIKKTDIDFFRTVRQALVKALADRAGVDLQAIGLDWGKINFSVAGKGSQVRTFGTTRAPGLYKTLIKKIPDHKPYPYELPLIFPEKVELWEIEGTEFEGIVVDALKREVERAKKANEHALADIDFSDIEITEFPCMKGLFEAGITNGRYYAGESVLLMCKKLCISKEETEKTLRELFKTFPGITQAETDLRINNVLPMYETDYRFSCRVLKEHFPNIELCNFSQCLIKKKLDKKNTALPNKIEEINEIEEISEAELKRLKTDLNTRRMPNLMNLLPPDHFINKVTKWMSGLTDTYYEFQVCAALWLLSALLQGKGSLKLKQGLIKPNLYIMLFGQSTKSRKSTAIKKIKNIYLAATNTELYNDEPTVEGYLETLSRNPVQNFVLDEASGLLAKFHKKYNDGIFDLECSIYDGESIRKIKAAGKDKEPQEFVVKNPYVTHLYATTPDKFTSVMKTEDFLCGYGYRYIYSFPTYDKKRKDIELEDKEDIEAWADVLTFIKATHQKYLTSSEFDFSISEDALKSYNLLGRELEDKAEMINNEHLDSAVARAEDNILKIAMLLEIGKREPSYTITRESIFVATLLTLDFFLPSFTAIMDRLLSDIQTNKIEKAIAIIRRMGGSCTENTLIHNAHFTVKECKETIEAMVAGEIVISKKIRGKKGITYILTNETKKLEINSKELTEMFDNFRKNTNLLSLNDEFNNGVSNQSNQYNQRNQHISAKIPNNFAPIAPITPEYIFPCSALSSSSLCTDVPIAPIAPIAPIGLIKNKSEYTTNSDGFIGTDIDSLSEAPVQNFKSKVVSVEEAARILDEEGI